MEPRLNVIVAALIELGVPISVDSAAQRAHLQNAIYIAQEAGLELGYNFAWHGVGPFSDDLADDYYEAARKLRWGGASIIRPLVPFYANRLREVKAMLVAPNRQMSSEQWTDLLATAHFLHVYAKRSDVQIRDLLRQHGARLSAFAKVRSAVAKLVALERLRTPA